VALLILMLIDLKACEEEPLLLEQTDLTGEKTVS
jgi:hypothetical protein